MWLLVLVAILSSPVRLESDASEYVDCLELNHFYGAKGEHVFDQVIFYAIDPATRKLQVRGWCIVEDRDVLNRRPVKSAGGIYRVDWIETNNRVNRTITSRMYRESWTQIDPERENKTVLPEGLRIGLISPPKKERVAE